MFFFKSTQYLWSALGAWSFYFLAVCESMSVIGIAWLLSMHACCHQKSCGVGRSVLLFVDPYFLLACSGQDCSNGPVVSTNGKSIYNLWGSLSDSCISWWFLNPCLRLEMLVCCPCCHQWGCGLARIVAIWRTLLPVGLRWSRLLLQSICFDGKSI